ncbi:MAG: response regulator [Lachnospiraceae bacterium]|nr:response regulator [Lachnospiraceae bacterium]
MDFDKRDEGFKTILQFVNALSRSVEAKDRYTNGHSERVAGYGGEIARRMGRDRDEIRSIYIAGLLHDVGKIRIPNMIINKGGKLTAEENDYIKLHPNAGYHILKDIDCVPHLAEGARFHHERYDGTGYPNGLAGEDIPEVARIIAVADAYDAMASNRSYRRALPQQVVRAEIEKNKGTQFDPEIADVMLEIIDDDVNYELREADKTMKNILIIDNEEHVRRELLGYFQGEEDYVVFEADSGFAGIEIMLSNHIDLVLMDVLMPIMDGFTTLDRIRLVTDKIPVVFLSEEKDIDTINKADTYGTSEYLTKPVTKAALFEAIDNVLKQDMML